MTVLRAHAKVNPWLHVLGREERSGYHHIETAFCRIELADELIIEPARRFELIVEGADLGDPATNLVSRAALAFAEATGRDVALGVRLTKRIPVGAGLGGGSSDAAALLRHLDTIHGSLLDGPSLHQLAQGIGADVPFFLTGAPFAMGWGRGERLIALDPPPAAYVVVIWPGRPVPTADAYHALSLPVVAPPAAPAIPAVPLSWDQIAERAGNDFEREVMRWVPEFADIRAALLAAGARFALLAGSGSAVFGLFEEDPDTSVARSLQAHFPDSLIVRTRTAVTHLDGVDPVSGPG